MTDKTAMMKLFQEISHCRNVRLCLDDKDVSHPCRNIVMSQKTILSKFKVPEPWSGHLDRVPILFLGSNPSITSNDRNPKWSSSDSIIKDYFINRFGGGKEEWVRDGIHVLDSGGKYDKTRWVRYWAAVRSRSAELLNKDKHKVIPGEDYVISEVVHCKSRNEAHVNEALDTCVKLYLARLIEISAARIIVCMGKYAQKAVCKTYDLNLKNNVYGPIKLGKLDRYLVFLPHPNSRGKRSFKETLNKKQINQLREILNS